MTSEKLCCTIFTRKCKLYIRNMEKKKHFWQLQTLEGLWDLKSSWSTLWEVMTWNKIQYYRDGLLFYNSCKRWICYKSVVLLEKQSKIKQANKKTQTLSFGSWDFSVAYSGKVWRFAGAERWWKNCYRKLEKW